MANGLTKDVNEQFLALAHRLDNELSHTILNGLPQRAVQLDKLWTKCKGIEISQSGNDFIKPCEALQCYLAEVRPVCQNAAEEIHLVESRLQRLVSDVRLSAEVLVGEVLDRLLKLVEPLRRDLEDLLIQLNIFHSNRSYHLRKVLKYPAQGSSSLEEFDRKTLSMTQLQLAKARNTIVALHGLLRENIAHLTFERAKLDIDGHSMFYH